MTGRERTTPMSSYRPFGGSLDPHSGVETSRRARLLGGIEPSGGSRCSLGHQPELLHDRRVVVVVAHERDAPVPNPCDRTELEVELASGRGDLTGCADKRAGVRPAERRLGHGPFAG